MQMSSLPTISMIHLEHLHVEEEIFYPALAAMMPSTNVAPKAEVKPAMRLQMCRRYLR
jgi:hypothetical protein